MRKSRRSFFRSESLKPSEVRLIRECLEVALRRVESGGFADPASAENRLRARRFRKLGARFARLVTALSGAGATRTG